MSNKDLKYRTPLANAVNTELLSKLKKLSKDTSIPISRLLDKAIELLLKEYEKK